jgi:NADPH-dependent 2,4-dienoyl-CoA reductase/sulfur reductase-like enzyme
MKTLEYEIAVIGGGAAGLTAAAQAAAAGKRTVVIERSRELGGVLLQCIHSGFGLHYFHEELTGPEYAARVQQKATEAGADFLLASTVMQILPGKKGPLLTVYSRQEGVVWLQAQAVILAMGCRERCRGNLGIPGDRVSGVYSAGTAQLLLNREGIVPGKRAVIVGSGDIGLIMARRLTWSGVKVACVLEIMPYPAGLSRNIAQCLEDFGIPLHLSTSITGIHGRNQVESVTFAPLVNGQPDLTQEERVTCDTVLFSVGLVPENELSRDCGIKLNPLTGGALVDEDLMTSLPGIFSCGNVLHVHDLVDFVSLEAERCADSAVRYCARERRPGSQIQIAPGANVRYVIPNQVTPGQPHHLLLRTSRPLATAELQLRDTTGNRLFVKRLRHLRPAEMISLEIPHDCTAGAKGLVLELEELN